jgi:hypothetical protein
MPKRSIRRIPLISRRQAPRFRKLKGRELDFLLLAGCSCILTLLHHPLAEALNSVSPAGSQGAIATESSKSLQQTGSIYLTLPPKREDLKEEEQEG